MIVPAGPAHAGIMAAIHKTAFPDDPWDEPSFAILLNQPGMRGLIDDRGGILLLRIAADEAEILTIGVITPRQGIARALLTAGIAAARSAGARTLFLEVAATNAPARALYAAAGFTRSGHRPRYYPNGTDALLLSLNTSP
jgi:ribosomal-protein-alanine N-acetyltransferase